MIRKLKYSILLSSILFTACETSTDFLNEQENDSLQQESVVDYEKGVIRIKLSEMLCESLPVNQSESDSIVKNIISGELTDLQIQSIERLYPYAGRFEKRTREMGMHLWYVIRFDSQIPQTKMSNAIIRSKDVIKVEKVPVIKHYKSTIIPDLNVALNQIKHNTNQTASIFNDPLLKDQWHYNNSGEKSNYLPGADVNVYPVWERGLVGNPDVIVCIVDGGVDYQHEDLIDNMYINEKELNGTPGIDDDGNGYIDDIYGYNFVLNTGEITPHDHGTHVAGTVAAKNNNSLGVAGIAGGNGNNDSGVRLMSAQIFTQQGGANGAPAIKYGADNGAVISQNSWGYPTLTEVPESDRLAIEYFTKYAGVDEYGNQVGPIKGGIVVFAAGNENRAFSVPGMDENSVAVTAIAPDYKKAYYSNYGEWADIAAPGGQVTSEYGPNQAGGVLSTTVGNTYQLMQGSSMACPHVSGAFALLASHVANSGIPDVTGRELIDKLLTNTRPIDNYNLSYRGLLGKGLLDIYRAVGGNSSIAPDAVKDLKILSADYNSVDIEWTVPDDKDDSNKISFMLYYSTASLEGVGLNNADAAVTKIVVGEYTAPTGSIMKSKITGLNPDQDYYIVIRAFDYSNNYSAVSNQVTVKTKTNGTPVITARDGSELTVKSTGSGKLRFDVSDPENDKLTISLLKATQAESFVLNNGVITVFINGAKASKGVYKTTLEVSDPYKAKAVQEITYTIVEQSAPVVTDKRMEDLEITGVDQTSKLKWTDYVKDEDGDQLDVVVDSSDPSVVEAVIDGDFLLLKTKGYGVSTISLTVSDRLNTPLKLSFEVLCQKDQSLIDISTVQFKLFPNPVKDNLFIETNSPINVNMLIKNSQGNVVYKTSDLKLEEKNAHILNLSKLKAGQYQVEIEANGKTIKRNLTKL